MQDAVERVRTAGPGATGDGKGIAIVDAVAHAGQNKTAWFPFNVRSEHRIMSAPTPSGRVKRLLQLGTACTRTPITGRENS